MAANLAEVIRHRTRGPVAALSMTDSRSFLLCVSYPLRTFIAARRRKGATQ